MSTSIHAVSVRMWVSINSPAPLAGSYLPLRLAEFCSKCPLVSHNVTSEACFLDPHPQKNKSGLQINMENILLFHIWKTEGPGATVAAGPARPRAIGSFPTQSLIALAPLGPPVQVSVILFHPVPALVTVLPVLLSLDDLSVAPTEETHL